VWDILSRWAKATSASSRLRGVIHCFSGDIELARRYTELGFLISLAGSLTYPRALDKVRVAQELPLDKLLVETDAPFLAPQLHRGRRNEPSYVALVVDKLAEIKKVPAAQVAEVTAQNAIQLFRLPGL
jgi:TatD DNase family protein